MFRIVSEQQDSGNSEPGKKFQVRPNWLKDRASQILAFFLGLILFIGVHQGWVLYQSAQQPIDAVLVLGGSIRREMYAAQLAKAQPGLPILISGGSDEPCIWLIFQRKGAQMSKTWIEPCADSTLGNYRFSTPVLKRWETHHVKLVTSGSHQLRAIGLGRIILGGHGIWLSPDSVPETGRPGNTESYLKTGLDWLRGIGWMIVSQVYSPECAGLHRLDKMQPEDWRDRPFECEHQGDVKIPPELRPTSHAPSKLSN